MARILKSYRAVVALLSIVCVSGHGADNSELDCPVGKLDGYRDIETKVLNLWVEPSSNINTCGNGEQNSPLNTIEQAQRIARKWTQSGKNTHGITVNLLPGDYIITQGLQFTSEDSGSPKAPIVYQGTDRDSVRLFGGLPLAINDAYPLGDGIFKQQLVSQESAKHIKVYDLTIPFGGLGQAEPHGWNLERPGRVAPAMLYSGGKKMTLSRWPNHNVQHPSLDPKPKTAKHTGMVSYKSVIDPGVTVKGKHRFKNTEFNQGGGTIELGFDRVKYWKKPDEIFVDGILAKSWEWTYNQVRSIDVAKKQITFKRGELSGISANKGSYFFFENIAQELDEPGEFYIDKATNKLYVYPTENFDTSTTVLALLDKPIIYVDRTRHVHFKNMTIDTGRSHGIETKFAQQMLFTQLTVRNVSGDGLRINGMNNTVSHSRISNTGGAGVNLSGGWGARFNTNNSIAQSLKHPINYTKGNNTVIHNVIHGFAWDQKSQIPGVSINGTGHTVMFNEFYDGPHFAILFRNTQDVKASHNYIHDLPTFHRDDGGAIYVGIGFHPHLRGIEISSNVLKDVPTNGIYIDNYSSGVLIEKNLLHNVGFSNNNFSGVNINGGGHNVMRNNWFSEVARPIKYNTFAERNAFENYYPKMKGVQAAFNANKSKDTGYEKYPDFAKFLTYKSKDDFLYQSSTAVNNVSVNRVVPLKEGTNNGVIEPRDRRWEVRQNVALNKPEGQVLDIVRMMSNVFSIDGNSWFERVKETSSYLPKINALMYQLAGNEEVPQAPINNDLIANGSFSQASGEWKDIKSVSDVSKHPECETQCLKITERQNHIGSAVYTVRGLKAGNTYRFAADLKTQSSAIGIGYSLFKDKKFTNGGWNQGMKVKSHGDWLKQQSWDIVIPKEFDEKRGLRIWVRTGGAKPHDIFMDNVSMELQ